MKNIALDYRVRKIDPAIIQIQDLFRKPTYALSPSDTPNVEEYTTKKHILNSCAKASSGKTPVYFTHPSEHHIPRNALLCRRRSKFCTKKGYVIKATGRDVQEKRLLQIRKAHELCRKLGCKNLRIPKARGVGEFLVEERLPISDDRSINMGSYVQNKESYTDAIREFTRFMFHTNLTDLVTAGAGTIDHIVGDCVRYDNLPLTLVEEKGKLVGKINLIDLEFSSLGDLEEKCGSPKDYFPDRVKDLVRIFPYHLETILEEARKLYLEIDDHTEEISERQKKGVLFLQKGFIDHQQFLEKLEVSKTSVSKLEEISSEEQVEIFKVFEEELKKLNRGENDYLKRYGETYSPGILGDSPQRKIDELKEVFPSIVEAVMASLQASLETKIASNSQELDPSVMVSIRSLAIKRETLLKILKDQLKHTLGTELLQRKESWVLDNLAEPLLCALFNGLIQRGKISGFIPGYGGHQISLIFC
ncbi:MAG: hypothetical protein O2779_05170 [Nanoarchaeota archaeon]|nr:hypothetical protein [Nanoarchaeota archaeon]